VRDEMADIEASVVVQEQRCSNTDERQARKN
jgi:hypothetical protein